MISFYRRSRFPFSDFLKNAFGGSRLGGQTTRNHQTTTKTSRNRQLFWSSIVAGSLGTGVILLYGQNTLNARSKLKVAPPTPPLYSKDDVAKHNSLENGIWVTFEGQVYDITKFVEQHPG